MNHNYQQPLENGSIQDSEGDLTSVNKLIFVKSYDEAFTLVESILAVTPGNTIAQFRRVELASKLGKLDELKNRCLQQVNQQEPTSYIPELLLGLIKLQNRATDYGSIKDHFVDMIARWGEHAALYYGIGICLQNEGKFAHAVESLQKCLTLDAEFYLPYFNLSQIYYHQGMVKKGDQCFHQYEQHAPFNLYGNFETHRRLCYEFLERDMPEEALNAIETLSQWWLEHKGECPDEIKSYELLLASKILYVLGDPDEANFRRNQALVICHNMLGDAKSYDTRILYFVAKALEEFDIHELALRFHQNILSASPLPLPMLDRIAKSYVSQGDFDSFAEVIEAAYQSHPDHQKVRFYRLLVALKRHGADVSAYLSLKEKVEGQLLSKSQTVETFQILHNLLSRYDGDPDIYSYLAAIYADVPHLEKAEQCYDKYLARDAYSCEAKLKAVGFYIKVGNFAKAAEFVEDLQDKEYHLTNVIEGAFKNAASRSDDAITDQVYGARDQLKSIRGLLAEYYLATEEWQKAIDKVERVLASDPWNLKYLCIKAKALAHQYSGKDEALADLLVGEDLGEFDDPSWDWQCYDRRSGVWEKQHRYGLVYLREKIRFLFFTPCGYSYQRVAKAARRFNTHAGLSDFMKLLNTNYHRPLLYGVLGDFSKELGLLEASNQWYQTLLVEEPDDPTLRSDAFLQLADSYIWQNANLAKAIEYLKVAMEFGRCSQEQVSVKMAHAYLKKGDTDRAQQLLVALENYQTLEADFVRGLIDYRNGNVEQAKTTWKPLLTHQSQTLIAHQIKGEIRRFYFQQEEYWQKN